MCGQIIYSLFGNNVQHFVWFVSRDSMYATARFSSQHMEEDQEQHRVEVCKVLKRTNNNGTFIEFHFVYIYIYDHFNFEFYFNDHFVVFIITFIKF